MKYSPYLDLNRDALTLEELMRAYELRGGESVSPRKETSEYSEPTVLQPILRTLPRSLPKAS
jgi:hypothetical protein